MNNVIKLQFSSSPAWQSMLIRKLCHSPFSHVDFVLPDGNLLGASDQGVHSPVISGNPLGVAVRPPDYQIFTPDKCVAIIKTDKADAIIGKAMTQLGKPFDASALTAFLGDAMLGELIRKWRDPLNWFCSELACWSFEQGGYWEPEVLMWPKNRVSPTDLLMMFMMSPNFSNRATFWGPVVGAPVITDPSTTVTPV